MASRAITAKNLPLALQQVNASATFAVGRVASKNIPVATLLVQSAKVEPLMGKMAEISAEPMVKTLEEVVQLEEEAIFATIALQLKVVKNFVMRMQTLFLDAAGNGQTVLIGAVQMPMGLTVELMAGLNSVCAHLCPVETETCDSSLAHFRALVLLNKDRLNKIVSHIVEMGHATKTKHVIVALTIALTVQQAPLPQTQPLRPLHHLFLRNQCRSHLLCPFHPPFHRNPPHLLIL